MTHTLHRFGDNESFKDDYIIFAIPSKGLNDDGSIPKLKRFLTICSKYNPVNMGNGTNGAITPEKDLNPSVHWKRKDTYYWKEVIEGVAKSGLVSAVFSTKEDAVSCLREVISSDFGLSVNMSTSIQNANEVLSMLGIKRHSIEYSLEFNDPHKHLPESKVLMLSTMCGHGMVSFNLAKRMIEMVQEGRKSPEEASNIMARFCTCGIFNPERAKNILAKDVKDLDES